MKSKECLEILKDEVVPDSGYLDYEDYGSYENEMLENYNIIKQDLDKLEELEKDFEVLKEDNMKWFATAFKFKKVIEILTDININIIELKHSKNVEEYNNYADMWGYNILTQEKYELLKEVLGNE